MNELHRTHMLGQSTEINCVLRFFHLLDISYSLYSQCSVLVLLCCVCMRTSSWLTGAGRKRYCIV